MNSIDRNILFYRSDHRALDVIPAREPFKPLENNGMMRDDEIAVPRSGLFDDLLRGIQGRQYPRTFPGTAAGEQSRIVIRFLVRRWRQRFEIVDNGGDLHSGYCTICSI